jgi:hypothetical protein
VMLRRLQDNPATPQSASNDHFTLTFRTDKHTRFYRTHNDAGPLDTAVDVIMDIHRISPPTSAPAPTPTPTPTPTPAPTPAPLKAPSELPPAPSPAPPAAPAKP